MNIVEKLGYDINIFPFEYFGKADWATNSEVKLLIENSDLIKKHYQNLQYNIVCINSFIDYLFLCKFTQFDELKNIIADDKKESFLKIMRFIEQTFVNYNNADLISYINANVATMDNDSKFNIYKQVVDISIKYNSGCLQALKYIFKESFQLILHNFDKVSSFIRKEEELLLEFCDKSHIEDCINNYFRKYLEALIFLSKYDNCKLRVNLLIEELIVKGKSIFASTTVDNVLLNQKPILELTEFFKKINHKLYFDFKEMADKNDVTLGKYLEVHGHQYSYEVPYKEMADFLDNPNNPILIKMMSLTHIQQKDKTWKSYHVVVGENNERSMLESIVTTNIPTNEYFSPTKQQSLRVYDQIFLNLLSSYYFNLEKLNDFFAMLYEGVQEVIRGYQLNYVESLEKEFECIVNHFALIIKNKDNANLTCISNYGLTVFICGMLEKLLRQIYIVENEDVNINPKSYSLGNLINCNNKVMVNIFGRDNLMIMAHYLIEGGTPNEVGRNIRNNYAHYKNISIESCDFSNTLKVLQMYLMTVNELLLFNMKREHEKNKENSNG